MTSAGSWKKLTKLSRPMNSQSVRSQRVRLKKNDENVGTMKKTKKTRAAGRQNQ
jgi:hypothetical protein